LRLSRHIPRLLRALSRLRQQGQILEPGAGRVLPRQGLPRYLRPQSGGVHRRFLPGEPQRAHALGVRYFPLPLRVGERGGSSAVGGRETRSRLFLSHSFTRSSRSWGGSSGNWSRTVSSPWTSTSAARCATISPNRAVALVPRRVPGPGAPSADGAVCRLGGRARGRPGLSRRRWGQASGACWPVPGVGVL
jgi:hypothetical protein